MDFLEMTNKDQEDHYKSTLNLVNIFVKSNQRKRINLLSDIESDVENIFSIGRKYLMILIRKEMIGLLVGYYKY
jgi:hypothetical protein